MQAAKDTFLVTLASRLAAVNPMRTVTLDGASRPAIMSEENETPLPANTILETFLLRWEGAGESIPDSRLMFVDCKLTYASKGSNDKLRTDRGRVVTAMDSELLQLCGRRYAAKLDYTQSPPAALGSMIFWTKPVMEANSDADGLLQRTATLRLYFFSEGA